MSEQEKNTLKPESDELQGVDSTSSLNEKDENESRTLREALNKFHITLPESTIQTLDDYCDLLWIWNERLNLTRHETYDKFVARDLVDSMRIAARLQSGERVLDVGSGGGAPGLIIAILRPDVDIELCEATGKKATALGDMVEKLDLDVPVWNAKAQELLAQRRYHTLTVRAVGKIKYLLELFAKSWNNFTRLIMVKGPKWPDERGEARHYNLFNKLALRKIDEYEIPDDGHSSVLLQVCQKSDFARVEQHAKDLAAGKPYGEPIDDDVAPEEAQGAATSNFKRRSRDFGRDDNRRGFRRGRAFTRDQREKDASSSDGVEERASTRGNAKPPKGWTGKKRDFKVEDLPAGVRPGRSGGDRRRGGGARGKSGGARPYSKRDDKSGGSKSGGSKRRPDTN